MAKLKWSIEDANAAREFIGQVETDSSLASEEDVSTLRKSLAQFDSDVSGGWNPGVAANPWEDADYKTPKDKQAEPPDYEARQDAIDTEARKYSDAPRTNATQKLANSARVDWYPEDGGEDGILGQKRTAHNYREPSPKFLIRYLQRAMNDAPDKETQKRYTDAIRDLHAKGEDTDAYRDMADNLWDSALRAAQKHGMPIARIDHKDIQAKHLLRDVDERAWAILEPAVVGFEKGATFGLGREAIAGMGAERVLGKREGSFLKEMEEMGLMESFGERLKEADTGGWRGVLGSVAEFTGMAIGAPKALAGGIARAGAKTFLSGAKATPALLRGTSLGQGAAGGMSRGAAARAALKKEGILRRAGRTAAEGAVAGGIEGAGEAAVRKGGRWARDEQGTFLAPIDPLKSGAVGAGFGLAGGALFGGVGGMMAASKRHYRRGEGQFEQDLAKVEMALGGEGGTSVLKGVKETPGMKRATDAALEPQSVGGGQHRDVFSPSEMAIQGVDRKVLAANAAREERIVVRHGVEMASFYKANSAPDMHYKGAAEELLGIMDMRKDIPFEDAKIAREAFTEMTTLRAFHGQANVDELMKKEAHLGIIDVDRAEDIFGKAAVKAKMGKVAPRTSGSRMRNKFDREADYREKTFFVVESKSVSPQSYDKTIQALDRRINYDKTVAGKDPIWGNLRHRIAEDRSSVKGWQDVKDKHHGDMNEVEDRWRALDLTQSFKDLPMTSASEDAVGRGVRSGLSPGAQKKRGFYDALGEDSSTMQSFMDARAIPARSRILTGSSVVPAHQAEAWRVGMRQGRLRIDALADTIDQGAARIGGRRTWQYLGRDRREEEARER